MPSVDIALLSSEKQLVAAAAELLERYIRLPDAWERLGGVPEELPDFFRAELDRLPGPAAPPDGDLLVVTHLGSPIGVGCIVPLDEDRCEFKRVYIEPEYQGTGVAVRLVDRMLARAAELGYLRVGIDVMPTRLAALAFWRKVGFTPCQPYRDYGFPMDFLDRALPATPS